MCGLSTQITHGVCTWIYCQKFEIVMHMKFQKKIQRSILFSSKTFWPTKKIVKMDSFDAWWSKFTSNDSYATLWHCKIFYEGIFKCLTSKKISFWHENKCFVTDFRRPKTFGKMDSFYAENVLQMKHMTRQNIT